MAEHNLQRSVTTATALRALGYEMSARPSFAFYNTKEEVDRLVTAIRKILTQ